MKVKANMATTPGCVDHAALFHHPVVEDGVAPSTPDEVRIRAAAASVCASCPLQSKCLYDAIVGHDVAGFVAGTTMQQRRAIRVRLGVTPEPQNLDVLAGVSLGNRPVDRDEVLRLRRANPSETLEQLAMRLGCSTSTVKRHLRKERAGVGTKPAPKPRPTMQQVLAAAEAVLRRYSKAA